jgi:glycosyltransferase involved in cell wall biosynthesis
MKIALISVFLDDGYEHILDDKFMEDVICQEDHHYHRTAYSLKMRNHEPVVFYISVEKELKKFTHKYGHTIIRVPAKRIPFFHEPIVYSPKLIKELENHFDLSLIFSYYVMYKVPDMFDYIIRKLKGKMPIIGRWSGGKHQWLFPIRKRIKKKSLENCNQIICAGKDEINVLKNIFDIPDSKIEFLINPHNLELFKNRDRIDACKKLEISPGKKYFLYVGRLVKNKGIEELLEVFNEIKLEYPNMNLILIGDGLLKEEILKFVEKNNLNGRVELKGRLAHDSICYYYNACSILFHIGTSGGLPNIVVEGVASGIPVIASENNANRDFVNQDLKTGIIIDAGDKTGLKNAIKEIIEMPDNFSGEVPKIIKELSFERYGEKLETLFKKNLKE